MTLAASLLIMDSMLLSEPELTSAFQLFNIYFVYLNVFYRPNLIAAYIMSNNLRSLVTDKITASQLAYNAYTCHHLIRLGF